MNFFLETVICYQCVELQTRLPSSQVIFSSLCSLGFSSRTTAELVCDDVSLLAFIFFTIHWTEFSFPDNGYGRKATLMSDKTLGLTSVLYDVPHMRYSTFAWHARKMQVNFPAHLPWSWPRQGLLLNNDFETKKVNFSKHITAWEMQNLRVVCPKGKPWFHLWQCLKVLHYNL